jgi:hypothetical protein
VKVGFIKKVGFKNMNIQFGQTQVSLPERVFHGATYKEAVPNKITNLLRNLRVPSLDNFQKLPRETALLDFDQYGERAILSVSGTERQELELVMALMSGLEQLGLKLQPKAVQIETDQPWVRQELEEYQQSRDAFVLRKNSINREQGKVSLNSEQTPDAHADKHLKAIPKPKHRKNNNANWH